LKSRAGGASLNGAAVYASSPRLGNTAERDGEHGVRLGR
jgi:hypothetical protein